VQATPDYRIAVNRYTGSQCWHVLSVSGPDSASAVDDFNERFVFSKFLGPDEFSRLAENPTATNPGLNQGVDDSSPKDLD